MCVRVCVCADVGSTVPVCVCVCAPRCAFLGRRHSNRGSACPRRTQSEWHTMPLVPAVSGRRLSQRSPHCRCCPVAGDHRECSSGEHEERRLKGCSSSSSRWCSRCRPWRSRCRQGGRRKWLGGGLQRSSRAARAPGHRSPSSGCRRAGRARILQRCQYVWLGRGVVGWLRTNYCIPALEITDAP